jgi:serine/threonine protein kinase
MPEFPSKVDIVDAMQNPVCYKSNVLIGGEVLCKNGRSWVIREAGGFAIVFPFKKANGDKIAVKCWFADIGDSKKRIMSISAKLAHLKSEYFIDLEYVDNALLINGQLVPVVVMKWVESPSLKEFLKSNIRNADEILKVAENFKSMVSYFHQNNLAHGDLSHGNIKVDRSGRLSVIDYDSMFIQELSGMPDFIKGLPGYQHPARRNNKLVNFKLDYFSELVIYLSLLVYAEMPDLFEKYYHTDDLLFSKEDYESPNNSTIFTQLMRSRNVQIANLTGKLLSFLKHGDILNLKPLEELLTVHQFDEIANSIINKF